MPERKQMSGVYNEGHATAYIQQFFERFRAIEAQLALISEKLDLPYENPGDGVPAEVVELARAGERIDAVKRYRALTGASLDVAHDVVSKL
jgi:ribosomal protein L7/L12